MKLLRIQANGLPLFHKTVEISFYAMQRVQEEHKQAVTRLFNNCYINNVEAFIGINASGKTATLKVISFVMNLLDAAALNHESIPNILGVGTTAIFDIDFYSKQKIYHLHSEILKETKRDGKYEIKIVSESLWSKRVTMKINKFNLLDFAGLDPIKIRDDKNHDLPEDVSIMIATKKENNDAMFSAFFQATSDFYYHFEFEGPLFPDLIGLLDPTIEYIKGERINQKSLYKLKFKEGSELSFNNSMELGYYLSLGTLKGIWVYNYAIKMLGLGGYFIIDEIENHLNKELVAVLIRFFLDQRTKIHGLLGSPWMSSQAKRFTKTPQQKRRSVLES